MNILFKNVTPSPIDGVIDLHTDIWDKEFDFTVNQNTKIYAPSGKGKSTFMHLIYGLRHDFRGDIYINQKNTKEFQHTDWAFLRQEKLSIQFQDLRLFLDLTAVENIQLKHELKPYHNFETLIAYFDRLNISHIKNKPCGQLSYGERQRVAIIRAITQPFEVLLLDEPFSHLDPNNAEIATAIIEEECKKRNAFYIYTSLGADTYLNETQTFRL